MAIQKRQAKQVSWSPSDKIEIAGSERAPFALIAKSTQAQIIFAPDETARREGIVKGMRLTDARAMLPALQVELVDLQADARVLRELALWCQRYTPVTSLDGADGLFLDISGAAHLLGGEDQLLKDLQQRLRHMGFESFVGLGPTPGAAWAMARYGVSRIIGPAQDLQEIISSLPVQALRLSEVSLKTVLSFGLKRLSQLFDLSRDSLERRFSSSEEAYAVLARLDQLMGVKPEPLVPLCPPPDYVERLLFAEPISATEDFHRALSQSLEKLCDRLEQDLMGVRSLTFWSYRADGGVCRITIQAARPVRDADYLMHLFKGKIEMIDPGHGVDCVALSADQVAALGQGQRALGTDKKYQRYDLATLIDRVSNRLGPNVITARAPFESYIPERSERRRLALCAQQWSQSVKPVRPLRLLSPPEPIDVVAEVPDGPPRLFRWRKVSRRIVKASGPERIVPEWWRDLQMRERTRDYYTLEDNQGRRYWLYREGLYVDAEGEVSREPRWLMHGLFA